MEIKQYQIILVNLDPTIGSEIKKTRPCVENPVKLTTQNRNKVTTFTGPN